ncbi:hemerythrin domain-containing protein [Cytophaga hutchinsonii]|uniref:Uncharacterized protein n=1 Tax=Cytophaga hutchinsonii (strain ATCC 33406 / DSM 1761 / CIP 103989 / NBRC 15051 / NCIMB 9469 / D465) TaxID=269798 RepID=A0A6N4SNT7_CYTH3|nr:hemerythrin domain-containing protein [Cytophaga hutchinsonii]ABG57978.1 conserved hypothetical protein [Cytophaga hutchinsonii ATCC 33406]SFX10489.1 regulator of cell morphogenesis and NO signaling [Cytophaga hutchinsonii ATCC 33406]
MKTTPLHSSLQELIERDYTFARSLFYLGIPFEKRLGDALGEVLADYGISIEKFNRMVSESNAESFPGPAFFKRFKVDAIIEYLKHAHYLYIKEKIPFISKLIQELPDTDKRTHDLKLVFPYVIEDFIKHIYHEEDSLFYYVLKLHAASISPFNESVMLEVMNKYSIHRMFAHHQEDDDEMKGIRELTNNYATEDISDIHLKLIYKELQAFEKELFIHACIENEVLFPKALELEAKVAKYVAESLKEY